ncbi:MAG: FdrA family protein [Clostridia bacterium]|nr:FdrA family protein [Clostridia bacterium]
MDSILILSVSREVMKFRGVHNAVVVMATDMNKTVIDEFGGMTNEVRTAGANDLIISIDCDDESVIPAIQTKVKSMVEGTDSGGGSSEADFRTLLSAKTAMPEANICIISLPGEYALEEAKSAIEKDMNLFIFSDMPEGDELEIKQLAHAKGLFVMGPGAGTAVINNTSLGLMSKVRPGKIGIVAASGSGLQEVAVLVHNYGEGISQAIGTGGHDLSVKVGGIMFLQGLDYLAGDPETDVIVLVSKPPHPDVARKIYAALPKNKPVIIFFLGGDAAEIKAAGAYAPRTLEEAAQMAVSLAGGKKPEEGDVVKVDKVALSPLASDEKAKLAASQKYLRGLFCGGTHSEEAVTLLQEFVPAMHSNIKFGKVALLQDRYVSLENSLVDMGDEVFTKGKPHPVMDPSILVDRMIQEAKDPSVGVILFDLLYGHAIHKDPVGAIEDALKEIKRIEREDGRHICVIGSLCGTDIEPQNVADQARRLKEYGVILQPSNAKAALLAGLIVY